MIRVSYHGLTPSIFGDICAECPMPPQQPLLPLYSGLVDLMAVLQLLVSLSPYFFQEWSQGVPFPKSVPSTGSHITSPKFPQAGIFFIFFFNKGGCYMLRPACLCSHHFHLTLLSSVFFFLLFWYR